MKIIEENGAAINFKSPSEICTEPLVIDQDGHVFSFKVVGGRIYITRRDGIDPAGCYLLWWPDHRVLLVEELPMFSFQLRQFYDRARQIRAVKKQF